MAFDDIDSSVPTVQVGNNTLYPELRTPKLCGLSAVRYEILDLDRHMDSSEMTPKGEYRSACGRGTARCSSQRSHVDWSISRDEIADDQNGMISPNLSRRIGNYTMDSSFYPEPILW